MVSMAALKLLLSEARRHCLARRHSHHHISPFLGFYRSLCSSSSSPSESDPIPTTATESPRRPSGTVPIQPVSYAPKPKDQSSPDQDRAEETPRTPAPQQPRKPPESLRSPSHETRPAWTSESDPIRPTATESPGRPSGTVPIQPVSYTLKPKDQSSPDQDPAEEAPTTPSPQQLGSPSHETRPAWTREEMRYVKDAPSISPVSYQSRVAPLPEDKASAGIDSARREGEGVREKRTKQNDAEIRMRRRVFKVVEEEKVAAPFPTLIKIEKKERKPILDLTEAIRQVKASAKCNFDETVEAHVRLGIPPKKAAGQGVRGNMTLPHGTGKVVRVAFFAEGTHAEEARAAGVDIVGGVELVEQIASSKKLNVDKCFATNEMILRMGKISRILRERGLWPDRRLGTVTNDVSEALKKVSKGHIEFKMDKTSNVHVGLGKVSYAEDNLRENVGAFVNALLHAKPAGLKKASKYAGYISSFHVCSTMGPGFSVSVQSLSKAADQYNKVYLK